MLKMRKRCLVAMACLDDGIRVVAVLFNYLN